MPLPLDFFARDTLDVARDLIGVTLIVGSCRGRIVETEAYTTDAASHAVTRRHKATIMSDTVGHIYVYQIYGVHYCLNFTTEHGGTGAVLIRAVEPLLGLKTMARRRGLDDLRKLATGPGCLCQAFGIDLRFNGRQIGGRLQLEPREHEPVIAMSPRVGISAAKDLPWRFFERGNPFVSRGPKEIA
jgi:DNA-3-methyladenine glycosylase